MYGSWFAESLRRVGGGGWRRRALPVELRHVVVEDPVSLLGGTLQHQISLVILWWGREESRRGGGGGEQV